MPAASDKGGSAVGTMVGVGAEPVLTVEIPGKPAGQGSLSLWRGRDGKERAKHPEGTVKHRNLMIGMLRDSWGLPALQGPVAVACAFEVARPLAHFGTGRNADVLKDSAPPRWVITPTDVDKMLRLVCDALTIAGVIRDDAQVALIRGTKEYAATRDAVGRTEVRVWAL